MGALWAHPGGELPELGARTGICLPLGGTSRGLRVHIGSKSGILGKLGDDWRARGSLAGRLAAFTASGIGLGAPVWDAKTRFNIQ